MAKIHITKNFRRERQFSPLKCKSGTFRIKVPCKNKKKCTIKLVLCKKKGSKKQSVQSILKMRKRGKAFNKKYWGEPNWG